jgi:hypothetical protein
MERGQFFKLKNRTWKVTDVSRTGKSVVACTIDYRLPAWCQWFLVRRLERDAVILPKSWPPDDPSPPAARQDRDGHTGPA